MSDKRTSAELARWSGGILGVGSLGFAAWALTAPGPFTAFMGVPRGWGRWLGLRDLVIGTAMLVRPGAPTFILRAFADAGDAVTARKPGVATGAAAFSLWALTAALASARGSRDRHEGMRF